MPLVHDFCIMKSLENFVAQHLFAATIAAVLVAGLGGCAQGPNTQMRASEQGLQIAFDPTFSTTTPLSLATKAGRRCSASQGCFAKSH